MRKYFHVERTADWDLHISTCEQMLPYLVAAGHYKYVSCPSHNIQAMKALPNSVETEFRKENFVVRQRAGKLNGMWTDMASEQTYNRDAKTKLFSGISQNPSTTDKYLKSLPALTSISQQTLEMAHMLKEESNTGKISPAKEKDVVTRIVNVLEKKINPFQSDAGDDLVNICTGQVAPSTDLVAAKEKGFEALKHAEEKNASTIYPISLETPQQHRNLRDYMTIKGQSTDPRTLPATLIRSKRSSHLPMNGQVIQALCSTKMTPTLAVILCGRVT